MARYDHLPIFRDAYDLTVHIEQIVRNFSRYHKYTLGTALRNDSRALLQQIIAANNAREDRVERLLDLRHDLESFKVLARLCQDSGAFASTRSYLYVAERITQLARQNEGWLRRSREQGEGRQRRRPRTERRRPDHPSGQLGLGLAPSAGESDSPAASNVE